MNQQEKNNIHFFELSKEEKKRNISSCISLKKEKKLGVPGTRGWMLRRCCSHAGKRGGGHFTYIEQKPFRSHTLLHKHTNVIKTHKNTHMLALKCVIVVVRRTLSGDPRPPPGYVTHLWTDLRRSSSHTTRVQRSLKEALRRIKKSN